jgi:hypothetical protein
MVGYVNILIQAHWCSKWPGSLNDFFYENINRQFFSKLYLTPELNLIRALQRIPTYACADTS